MLNNIERERKKRNLTQEELARICGVTRQSINAIENNKYDAVLINDFTNSTHSKLTNSSAKAVLIFHHVTPKNLGGISSFSKLETVYKNYKKG